MKPDRRTLETVDVQLHAGRVLRLDLERTPTGEPELLRIREAWTSGGYDRDRGVQVPGHLIPKLREALEALEEGDAT